MPTLRDRESDVQSRGSWNRRAAGITVLAAFCFGGWLRFGGGESPELEPKEDNLRAIVPQDDIGPTTYLDTPMSHSSPRRIALADEVAGLPEIGQDEREELRQRYLELKRDIASILAEYPTLDSERDLLRDKINGWVTAIGDVTDEDEFLHHALERARLNSQDAFYGLDEEDNHFHFWLFQFPMRFTNEEAIQLSKLPPDPLPPLKDIVSILGKDRIVKELSPDQLFDILGLFNLKQFTECFGPETLAHLEEHDRERFINMRYHPTRGEDMND